MVDTSWGNRVTWRSAKVDWLVNVTDCMVMNTGCGWYEGGYIMRLSSYELIYRVGEVGDQALHKLGASGPDPVVISNNRSQLT